MKPALTWSIAASCLLLLTGSMAWATWSLVGMERTRQRMEADAVVQERTRLALWRMESVAAALVLEESARAPEQYETPPDGGSSALPAIRPDERVWLHFEMDPDGRVHSPQAPEGSGKSAEPGEAEEFSRRLRELRVRLAEKAGPEQWASLGRGLEPFRREPSEPSAADNRAWLSYANTMPDPLLSPQLDAQADKDGPWQKSDTKPLRALKAATPPSSSPDGASEAKVPSALKPTEAQQQQENYNQKEADVRQQLIAGNYSQRRSLENENLERKMEGTRFKDQAAAPEARGLETRLTEEVRQMDKKGEITEPSDEKPQSLAANAPAAPGLTPAAPASPSPQAPQEPMPSSAADSAPAAPDPAAKSRADLVTATATAAPSPNRTAGLADQEESAVLKVGSSQAPPPSLSPPTPGQAENLAKSASAPATATAPPVIAAKRVPQPQGSNERGTDDPSPSASAPASASTTLPPLDTTSSSANSIAKADPLSVATADAAGGKLNAFRYFGADRPATVSVTVTVSDFRALWIKDALFLTRRVSRDGAVSIQGAWVDWPKLRGNLLATVADLFPVASLEAAPAGRGGGTDLLASLPVRFLPGALKLPTPAFWSPLKLSLATAWACVLLATVAVLLVLRGMMLLSERRASFVSAVTHELRTPLATFKLYSEMLADGMVKEESKRQRYLETLSSEADRLGHLVENVLSYSRLESGKVPGGRAPVALRDLLQRLGPRLSQRVEQAGGEWQISADALSDDISLTTDPAAVEQILFNLVDNACKYARRDGAAARVELDLRAEKGRVLFALRDYGPGISRAESKKLFRPFHKSARDAAHTAPGVGLGLALCRRLARDLGGTLEPDHTWPHGACFVLRLPV